MHQLHKAISLAAIFLSISVNLTTKPGYTGLFYPDLVKKFYNANGGQVFWLNYSSASGDLRKALLNQLDSVQILGLERNTQVLLQLKAIDNGIVKVPDTVDADKMFTDAAITLCKEIYQGSGIANWIEYDEWSKKYEDSDNQNIVDNLVGVKSAGDFVNFIHGLEPVNKKYLDLKSALKGQLDSDNKSKAGQLAIALNFYRWVHHFHFDRFIEVNVGAATLRYFDHDSERLFSRMVVGKPSTKTPRFDASCKQVILYPYWNVPQDIALRELVPKYKKSRALFDVDNMQVVDAKDKVVSYASLDWSKYSRGYFPYRLRQATGCDNSLGIIKFDLTSPFDVYLHDTNVKGLFNSKSRYHSHGCMRVERAIELGNLLLNNKLDTAFLQSCIKGEKPVTILLDRAVPVFVVYLTADFDDSGAVTFYNDTYHLLKVPGIKGH